MSFIPTSDLTLRQAFMTSGVVSTDGDFDIASLSVDEDSVQQKILLSSSFGFPFSQLAFPVPEGTPIYFTAASQSEALLIFS